MFMTMCASFSLIYSIAYSFYTMNIYSCADLSICVFSMSIGPDDNLSGIFPSLVDDQSDFTRLVSDLRGDGDNFVKMLVGDVKEKEILRLGHRSSENYVKVGRHSVILIFCYIDLLFFANYNFDSHFRQFSQRGGFLR